MFIPVKLPSVFTEQYNLYHIKRNLVHLLFFILLAKRIN